MYIYGAGGHAKVIMEILLSQGIHVLGFFEDSGTKKILNGIPVFPGIKLIANALSALKAPLIIGIGDNVHRAAFSTLLDTNFGTAIDSSAIISSDVTVCQGTVIMQGVIVQSSTFIGEHTIINTGARVDHDCVIENFVHISPGAILCGRIHIGEGTHVGAGAIIIPGIKIGKWCVIGAGAVVIRDVPGYTTVVGNPARLVKKVEFSL